MEPLETLRHRMNWMHDYSTGHTTHQPPIAWTMAALQQEYFEQTGYGWDPIEAVNTKVKQLSMVRTELTVRFDCAMPRDEIICTLNDIQLIRDRNLELPDVDQLTPPMYDFEWRLKNELERLNYELCTRNLCECNRIVLTTIQKVLIVRLMHMYCIDVIGDMIDFIERRCLNSLETSILDHVANDCNYTVDDVMTDLVVGQITDAVRSN